VTTDGWTAAADLVVVGSGVAGLTAALQARECGLRVLVVTKADPDEGNTRWAQGGVAVAGGHTGHPGQPGRAAATGRDSVARHVADTIAAGAGLCDEAAARSILAGGQAAVATLRRRGAVFDRGPGGRLARTREGGHSAWRVIHAGGDATGAEIERALLAAAATSGGAVPVLAGHTALDVLLTDAGAVAGLAVLGPDRAGGVDGLDGPGGLGGAGGPVARLYAPAVLLATGGLGQLYATTTNPEVATGDGLALALRAGATVADLEFVQFHPTVLYTGAGARGRRPLVTEAVRGEGAVLVDAAGRALMAGVHPLGDLAPRDVVAAAITRRMAAEGTDHVYLDATGLGAGLFARRFPTVLAACAAAGIDPVREPIPVAPAAHYACGGVVTSVSGRTEVRGLYAAGEVARTGLHGANRLASNSLLEGLVLGARAARAVAADLAGRVLTSATPTAWDSAGGTGPDPAPTDCAQEGRAQEGRMHTGRVQTEGMPPGGGPGLPAGSGRDAVQLAMSRYAGIGRDGAGLAAALAAVAAAAAQAATAEALAPATGCDGSGPVQTNPVQTNPAQTGSAQTGSARVAGWAASRTRAGVEDTALCLVAAALLTAAAARTETRGCHVRTDHPRADDARWRRSVAMRLDGRGRPVLAELSRTVADERVPAEVAS
jgi:L-aspartate oxidase